MKILLRAFKLTKIEKSLEWGSISKHHPIGRATEEWLLIRIHVAVGARGMRFARRFWSIAKEWSVSKREKMHFGLTRKLRQINVGTVTERWALSIGTRS
jgi:hypothetical protein